MTIQVAPEIEALIRERVASGRYATADEAILAAFGLLDARDQQVQQLRAKL
jgi:putative addiction module CopG family antidote